MIAELGLLSLIIALLFASALVIVPTIGIVKNQEALQKSSDTYIYAQFLFVLLAYIFLTICFLLDDFSVLYVLNNSSKLLPWFYKLCALWGGHEGSMLLWVLILSAWMLLISIFTRNFDQSLRLRIQIVLGLISVCFILFVLITSNPFLRQFELVDTMGRDLNPLLQDPGFLFHPPTLYIGYVGFAFPFAFAIATLWKGSFDKKLARLLRPWVLLSWCFLTAGITLGSWWAYRELGWGGWWFWDPVENASFMPWLIATALIHCLIVSEKKEQYINWTILLSIIAFSLSLLGTFLVRSGVLTSVHSFAVDPARGIYILSLLVLLIGGALLLFAFRCHSLYKRQFPEMVSKENALLFNAIIMLVIMLTVLLGTLYPLIIDALNLGKLSVGAPYFNTVLVPLAIPVFIVMGIGIHLKWQKNSREYVFERLKYPLIVTIITSFLILIFSHGFKFSVLIGVPVAIWIITTTVVAYISKIQKKGFRNMSNSMIGMTLAHLGVAATILGIAISSGYGLEKDIKMSPGESTNFAGYQISFINEAEIKASNYHGSRVQFQIIDKNRTSTIYPEKRIYNVGQMVMTDSAIDVTPFRDIYIALGEPLDMNSWSVRLYYKPLVRWIWAGGFLMLIGGVFSFTDKRYMVKK